jgi:inward rectifier potassium channel
MPRPVVKKQKTFDGGGGGSGGSGSARGMEWSLRSLRQYDNNARYFLNNYYSDDSESDNEAEPAEDQTAYQIFKGKQEYEGKNGDSNGGKPNGNITGNIHHPSSVWATLNAPLRVGVVDGRRVVFELKENVTQRPTTPRSERLKRKTLVINGDRSSLETRLRFWLMHFPVSHLTWIYFVSFVATSAFFAAIFYFDEASCSGDPESTYADCFNLAIQTATTVGYGVLSPKGHLANFLVVILSYIVTLMNTLFAGLLFTKFVTPVVNIQFSEVMTLCNVNGVPCLSLRLGSPDGDVLNPMTDINVRLTYSYQIPYTDHRGEQKFFRQTEDLNLLSNRQHGLKEGYWTLRHILDENSPLFGLNFEEHPANKIYVFTLSVDAVQDLTKSSVNVQTEYGLEDILVGHTFQSLVDENSPDYRHTHNLNQRRRIETANIVYSGDKVYVRNFAKLSETEPYPVWYPAKQGAYVEDKITFNTARIYNNA